MSSLRHGALKCRIRRKGICSLPVERSSSLDGAKPELLLPQQTPKHDLPSYKARENIMTTALTLGVFKCDRGIALSPIHSTGTLRVLVFSRVDLIGHNKRKLVHKYPFRQNWCQDFTSVVWNFGVRLLFIRCQATVY
jgi:hypothetical protein